ncbi:MAG: FecR domain-containing protein [Bacteroidales bacterium]
MNWSAIAKYIFGEASHKEVRKIENWMNKSHSNRQIIKDINYYLNKEMKTNKQENINVDEAWGKLKARIVESDNSSVNPSLSKTITFSRSILKYAAILAIFLGISALAYFSYQSYWKQNYVTIETSQFEKRDNLHLPDGTVAFLNGNSKINYAKKYGENERAINVEGEAYFDVKTDISKPFIVKAKQTEVKVLGTSFNVRTDLPDNAVEVIVETGKVKFYKSGNENEAILLEPGFIGLLKNNQLKKKRNDDLNYLAWKNGKLLFNETNLDTVINKLNRAYNVKIEVKDSEIYNYELSATFEDEPVENILKVITRTFDLNLEEKENRRYILTSANN